MAAVLASGCTAAAQPPRPRLRADDVAALRANAAQDPLRLLLLTAVVEDAEAERLRQQIHSLLPAWKRTASAADLLHLTALLMQTVQTPAELRQVLGAPTRVTRQMIHRRYLEQWTYDAPGGLCVVWDCPRGLEPRLRAIHLLGGKNN